MLLSVFGDVCLKELKINELTKEYDVTFDGINDITEHSDYSIFNLECALGDESSYSPISKTGPNLICNKSIIRMLKKCNFDVANLANNHFGDYGEKCIMDSIRILETEKMLYVGAGKNLMSAYEPLRIESKDVKISIFSVCENEFGVAEDSSPGVAGYNVKLLSGYIRKEREEGKQVIVIFHGGMEHCPIPTPYVVERYQYLIDIGATLVIGMHPHCTQGFERYKTGVIFYSLGNFVFPKDVRQDVFDPWNNSIGVCVDISPKGIEGYSVIPCRYIAACQKVMVLEGMEKTLFMEYIERLNALIYDKRVLKEMYSSWCLKTSNALSSVVNVYSEDNDIKRLNLFRCETHTERMKTYYSMRSSHSDTLDVDVNCLLMKDKLRIPFTDKCGMKQLPPLLVETVDELKALFRWMKLCIYGTGLVAEKIMERLNNAERSNVLGYLVTEQIEENTFFWGKKVTPINDDRLLLDSTILVGVSSKFREEICYLLNKYESVNYAVISDGLIRELLKRKKDSGVEYKSIIDDIFDYVSFDEGAGYPLSVYSDVDPIKERAGYAISKVIELPNYEVVLKNCFGFKNYLDSGVNNRLLAKFGLPFDCYPLLCFFREYIDYAECVFDVGACRGIVSCFFSPMSRIIYAFEPSARATDKARMNININGFKNIIWNDVGVSDREETLRFYEYEKTGHNSFVVQQDESIVRADLREVTTIDDYCLTNGIDHIEVMKIDVEGFEPMVIRGAKNTLGNNRIGIIAVEHNLKRALNRDESINMFRLLYNEYGFRFFDLHMSSLTLEYIEKTDKLMDIIAINPSVLRDEIECERIRITDRFYSVLDSM